MSPTPDEPEPTAPWWALPHRPRSGRGVARPAVRRGLLPWRTARRPIPWTLPPLPPALVGLPWLSPLIDLVSSLLHHLR